MGNSSGHPPHASDRRRTVARPMRRSRLACLPAVVGLLLVLGSCSAEDAGEQASSAGESPEPPDAGSDRPRSSASPDKGGGGQPDERPTDQQPADPPATSKAARGFLVSRVIDGDTVELGTGQTVRLVGIDTPERGECGFEQATDDLVDLVEGKTVRLTSSDENADRYGRLLRYIDVGDLDAGLRLIKNGRAIARYDSRDGYGFHPRETRYVAADRASPPRTCAPEPAPAAATAPGGSCAGGYDPCVPPYPPDVDCADVDGPVTVTGADPHGLDADGDGAACES